MDLQKQKLLLQYLMSSPDVFALCKSIVKADYFDPKIRKAITFLHTYYESYNALPSPDVVFAETSIKAKVDPISKDEIAYCARELEVFCQRKALEQAILTASTLTDSGDYGIVEKLIKDALTVSLNKNLGIDYYNDPLTRLERMLTTAVRQTTGWSDVDDILGGGLARSEMILFTANSGGGKSIALANLGYNFLMNKLNVLYISLELSDELISQRFDILHTGISSVVWKEHYQEIAGALSTIAPSTGKLQIKRMPVGTNSNTIRSYLKEFELTFGYVPDLLIVDYLDLMDANEKVSADNIWEKDKRAAEQLRDIGADYNMYVATASQQNRAAVDAPQINQSHIAGGITKINTVDWVLSIVLTPTMKAAGEIAFTFLKTRSSDGVGKTIYLKWDNKRLRIYSPVNKKDVDEDGVIIQRVSKTKGLPPKPKSLLDVMDDL